LSTANQDITLWESFRKGDREAFATLFRQHYAVLFKFGSKFTTETELLEDCIQELFIELWQAKSQAPVHSVRAYLLKSLKYKLLKIFRKKGRIVQLQENTDGNFEWSHENFLIAEPPSISRASRETSAEGVVGATEAVGWTDEQVGIFWAALGRSRRGRQHGGGPRDGCDDDQQTEQLLPHEHFSLGASVDRGVRSSRRQRLPRGRVTGPAGSDSTPGARGVRFAVTPALRGPASHDGTFDR